MAMPLTCTASHGCDRMQDRLVLFRPPIGAKRRRTCESRASSVFLCPFAKGFFGIIVFLERHVVFRNKCAMTYFRQETEGEAK